MELNQEKSVIIHGWVMLGGIKNMRYLIEKVDHKQHGLMYWFKNPRTKKTVIGHMANDVEMWIKPVGVQNNFIEVL
jgi:hypothetical protein